ncbi:conserved hypothetical protein [Ricinus communis]|uniref:Uncharacterized protein n=1 Tax=Ricinus communis TaxID=3988 RepID=B9T2J2_RICCO|nr:conserved hypothetical protein [Ricinus communis]
MAISHPKDHGTRNRKGKGIVKNAINGSSITRIAKKSKASSCGVFKLDNPFGPLQVKNNDMGNPFRTRPYFIRLKINEANVDPDSLIARKGTGENKLGPKIIIEEYEVNAEDILDYPLVVVNGVMDDGSHDAVQN